MAIFQIIFSLTNIFLIFILTFSLAVAIVKLWCGCTIEEAIKKVNKSINNLFFNETPQYNAASLQNDAGFFEELRFTLLNIIGDKRFEELTKIESLSNTLLMGFDMYLRLPCIFISFYATDQNEKNLIEAALKNIIQKYLLIYQYGNEIIVIWDEFSLGLSRVRFIFFRNTNEKTIFHQVSQIQSNKIITTNSSLKDDIEGEDLN